MKTYSEIFLPIELNRSLQEILIKVHHHFCKFKSKEADELNVDVLREIYSPILECPILRDDIVWFNAWIIKFTGKYKIYYLKKDSYDISEEIINISEEKDFDLYVSSLSSLANNYRIK